MPLTLDASSAPSICVSVISTSPEIDFAAGDAAAVGDAHAPLTEFERELALDVACTLMLPEIESIVRRVPAGAVIGVGDRHVDVAAVVAAHLVAARVDGLHFGAAAPLGDVDLHQPEQLPRLVGRPRARRLDDLDRRVAAAGARHDDVARRCWRRQLAVGADFRRPGLPIGLLLAPLLVAPVLTTLRRVLDASSRTTERIRSGSGCARGRRRERGQREQDEDRDAASVCASSMLWLCLPLPRDRDATTC